MCVRAFVWGLSVWVASHADERWLCLPAQSHPASSPPVGARVPQDHLLGAFDRQLSEYTASTVSNEEPAVVMVYDRVVDGVSFAHTDW